MKNQSPGSGHVFQIDAPWKEGTEGVRGGLSASFVSSACFSFSVYATKKWPFVVSTE